MTPADTRRLLLLATLWGGSFLFIRVAVPVLGPVVTVKLTACAIILVGTGFVTGFTPRFPRLRRQKQSAVPTDRVK